MISSVKRYEKEIQAQLISPPQIHHTRKLRIPIFCKNFVFSQIKISPHGMEQIYSYVRITRMFFFSFQTLDPRNWQSFWRFTLVSGSSFRQLFVCFDFVCCDFILYVLKKINLMRQVIFHTCVNPTNLLIPADSVRYLWAELGHALEFGLIFKTFHT